jgi:hypothetical protein
VCCHPIEPVAGSLKNERGKLRLGETNTKQSRTVDLPQPVWTALKAHEKRQKAERLKVGSAWRNRGLVFTTEVGTPIDPSNLRRTAKALCEAAKVDPVSPNELGRHTAASLLYDAGMSLDEIADLLGHNSTRMLEAHYRHRVRESFGRHVQHVEAIFGAAEVRAAALFVFLQLVLGDLKLDLVGVEFSLQSRVGGAAWAIRRKARRGGRNSWCG